MKIIFKSFKFIVTTGTNIRMQLFSFRKKQTKNIDDTSCTHGRGHICVQSNSL